jgi:tetratricopeptide (TPR) repeat protein
MNTLHRILCTSLATLCLLTVSAQLPKNLDKVRKAVFTITTYKTDGSIKGSGFGFFIDENGTALSDYDLFNGAAKADIVDADGKKYSVSSILGANDMYNIVKFQVENVKKIVPLTIAQAPGAQGDSAYVLHYTTNKFAVGEHGGITNVSHFSEDNFPYYTLSIHQSDKSISCPLVNANGEVLGLIQPSAKNSKDGNLFAISINYCNTLAITALSASSKVLDAIGIPKALPNTEEQALVYLYMKLNSLDQTDYLDCLNKFISKYPKNADGYVYRAQAFIGKEQYEQAETDMNQALQVADKKDDVHYSFSKMLYQLALYKPKASYKDWNLDKALQETQAAYDINPLPVYTVQMGNILYAQKKYPEAYEKYVAASRTNLKSADLFSYAAQAKKMAGGSTAEILALQDSAVGMYTKPYIKEAAPYLLNRAQTRYDAEKYRDAVSDYNEYEHLMLESLNDRFYYQREQAELKGRMFQQALNDIEQAIKLNDKEPVYYAEYSSLLYGTGQITEAMTAVRKAIQLDPSFADAYRILGVCLASTGKKAEAIVQLKKAKELGDPNSDALIEKYSK